jgi:hypothetical protein
MKRLSARGLAPGIFAVVAIAAIIAACAPPPAGPPPDTTTSTTGVTTTTIADTVPDCAIGAVGTVVIGEEPINVPTGFLAGVNNVEVCYNFGSAGEFRPVFIEQCWAPASTPGFNVSINCYKSGEISINPAANPTGAGKTEFRIFRGAEPSGDSDWGCFAPGDTVPPGITPYYTCHVRVTVDSFLNNSEALSVPFTMLP